MNETQACRLISKMTDSKSVISFTEKCCSDWGYKLNPSTDYSANAIIADANLQYHVGKVLRCAYNKLKTLKET